MPIFQIWKQKVENREILLFSAKNGKKGEIPISVKIGKKGDFPISEKDGKRAFKKGTFRSPF